MISVESERTQLEDPTGVFELLSYVRQPTLYATAVFLRSLPFEYLTRFGYCTISINVDVRVSVPEDEVDDAVTVTVEEPVGVPGSPPAPEPDPPPQLTIGPTETAINNTANNDMRRGFDAVPKTSTPANAIADVLHQGGLAKAAERGAVVETVSVV